MTALLATLALFLGGGWGTAVLLRLDLPQRRASRLATFYLAGLVANGTLLYLLGVLHVPISLATVVAVPALLALAAAVVVRRRSQATPPAARDSRLAWLVLAMPLLALLVSAALLPVRDLDGRVFWLPKARAIAVEQAIDGPFFQGKAGLNMHNRYPLLLPLDAAAVMQVSRDTENEAARWLFVLAAVAALVAARGILERVAPESGRWVIAGAAWLPVLAAVEGGALSAYADISLAAFVGMAVLLLAGREASSAASRTAALFLAGAVLTKNEGSVLAAVVVIAAAIALRPPLRRLAVLAGAPAAAWLLLAVWRPRVPEAYDERYAALADQAAELSSRIPHALNLVRVYALDWSVWGGFWVLAAGALAVGLLRDARRTLFPALVVLGGLAAYTAALTVTSWDPDQLALVAMDRLLFHLVLPACAIVALAAESVVLWSREAPAERVASGKIRAR